MKTCSKCKLEKSETEFGKDSRLSSGLQSRCKSCCNEATKEKYRRDPERWKAYAAKWRQKNPDYQRNFDRQHREKNRERINARERQAHTGWTPEQFEEAWIVQKGQCAICDIDMTRGGKSKTSVSADHCHETKAIRKLLCNRCNIMLGHARDSARILLAAAQYLSDVG